MGRLPKENGMEIKSIDDQFSDAAKANRKVVLRDKEGNERVVEPYMIYTSPKGKRCLHVYQTGGYSKSGKAEGFRNPALEEVSTLEVLAETFVIRKEYNPHNEAQFPEVHFSLPDASGGKRDEG
jgi:hypothetical protein